MIYNKIPKCEIILRGEKYWVSCRGVASQMKLGEKSQRYFKSEELFNSVTK